ncbi:MAG: exonuclease domain-containing protein [Chloroflexota bacterium]
MQAAATLSLPLERVPFAFVDVETTGLSARGGDRICEVAVVVLQGGCEVHRFVTLVDPGRPISPGAAAVNGLSAAKLRGAPAFADVAAQVAAALGRGVPVAHNAPFDLSFLALELGLAGWAPPAPWALDTLALARGLLPRGQRCGLSALAASFGIATPAGAHRALADACTTAALLGRLQKLAGLHGEDTLADLFAWQGGPIAWPRQVGAAEPLLPVPLADAVRARQAVSLVYLAAGGTRTERVVELSGVYSTGDHTYLVGQCRLRQEQRSFRLDRILTWEPA